MIQMIASKWHTSCYLFSMAQPCLVAYSSMHLKCLRYSLRCIRGEEREVQVWQCGVVYGVRKQMNVWWYIFICCVLQQCLVPSSWMNFSSGELGWKSMIFIGNIIKNVAWVGSTGGVSYIYIYMYTIIGMFPYSCYWSIIGENVSSISLWIPWFIYTQSLQGLCGFPKMLQLQCCSSSHLPGAY